jgi:peptidoglycan/LPS O-acetylase OafA/YrhL
VGTFGPSWSITCELIYYAVAPVIKRCTTKVLLICLGASFLAFIWHHDNNWASLIYGRAVLGLAGFWLAGFLFYRHRDNRLAPPVFVAGIIAVYTLNWNTAEPYAGINLLISVLAIVYTREIYFNRQTARLLNYLGEISYPLYLVHFPFYVIMYGYFHPIPRAHSHMIYLFPLGAILAAMLIYHTVDRPARKFILEKFGVQKPLETMHAVVK